MKNYIAIFLSCVMGLTLLTGCYTHPTHHHKHRPHHKQKMHKAPRHRHHYGIDQGQVSNIEMLIVKAEGSGEGAIVGGVVEHQPDSDTDPAMKTNIAMGGAVAGNEIAKPNENDREIYRITVNVDNGDILQFEYEEIEDLRIGDRVKIENGHIDLI